MFFLHRVSTALPSRVLHQKHECGGDVGQRGAGGLPRRCEKRVAAGKAQRHQHHLSSGPRGPGASAYQQSKRGVKRYFIPDSNLQFITFLPTLIPHLLDLLFVSQKPHYYRDLLF